MDAETDDDLSILTERVSDTKPPRVWLGFTFSFVVLVVLTMAAIAATVFVAWGVSLVVSYFDS